MFCSGLRAGYLAPVEQRVALALQEAALIDQLEVVDVDAFLLDGGRARRHRAGREAADVLVVAAAMATQNRIFAVCRRRRTPA